MGRMRVWVAVGCGMLFAAAVAQAPQRRAGLWELTTTMTMPSAGGGAAQTLPAHTAPVCFAQAMIDKYGAIMPSTQPGCKIENLVVKPGHMTADMVCTGANAIKATLESSWTDPEHATGSIHFTGTKGGQTTEWTTHTTAVFKGADCGAVKPAPMPN